MTSFLEGRIWWSQKARGDEALSFEAKAEKSLDSHIQGFLIGDDWKTNMVESGVEGYEGCVLDLFYCAPSKTSKEVMHFEKIKIFSLALFLLFFLGGVFSRGVC
jgi:hypothetical protein